MNKFFWLVNAVLVIFALLVTVALARYERLPERTPEAVQNRVREQITVLPPVSAKAVATVSALPPALDRSKADVLWQKSLFRPDRSEESLPESTPGGEVGARFADMELTGIAVIGTQATAIIVTADRNAAGLRTPNPTFHRNSTSPPPGTVTGPKTIAAIVKHVFRVGEMVGDSGYTVKDIRMDQVVLAHGDEERVLKLEKGDSASRSRTDQAAKESATRNPPLPASAPRPPVPQPGMPGTAGFTVQPPPPPPAPIAAGNSAAIAAAAAAGSPVARDDRIKAALEARRKLINDRLKNPQAYP